MSTTERSFEEELRFRASLAKGETWAVEEVQRKKLAEETEKREKMEERVEKNARFLEENIKPLLEQVNSAYLEGNGRVQTGALIDPDNEDLSSARLSLIWGEGVKDGWLAFGHRLHAEMPVRAGGTSSSRKSDYLVLSGGPEIGDREYYSTERERFAIHTNQGDWLEKTRQAILEILSKNEQTFWTKKVGPDPRSSYTGRRSSDSPGAGW